MLNKLIIKNLKCLADEGLLLKPLTILTGANSSGKSTVIQALMLLIGHSQEVNIFKMEELLLHLDNFTAIRNKTTNAKEIYIEVISTDGQNHRLELTDNSAETDSSLQYYFEAKESQQELLYLNANRVGAEDLTAVSQQRKVGEYAQYLFSHFERIKGKSLPDYLVKYEGSNTLGYQLSQWLTEITGSEMELKTELVGDRVKVFYSANDIGSEISPFNLGAGVSYIAKVLIICLMAKQGDLVLIENPEIHLHPKSQALIGAFLSFIASKGIQLIVETHSEHLINRIRLEASNENISSDDVVVHYKPSSETHFQTLLLDAFGHFCDQDEVRQSFPTGFFDASVDTLLSLR
ncbi:AAA family ATPase [Endozoicomonas acroporae]|uniref:AAA family ATPase n=1 Tax=Endozoicomonas acroporae TaxID=1701104 RepID=UPI000C774A7C|nr:AAA family ATPase [Endozoicomonas acroporae]